MEVFVIRELAIYCSEMDTMVINDLVSAHIWLFGSTCGHTPGGGTLSPGQFHDGDYVVNWAGELQVPSSSSTSAKRVPHGLLIISIGQGHPPKRRSRLNDLLGNIFCHNKRANREYREKPIKIEYVPAIAIAKNGKHTQNRWIL